MTRIIAGLAKGRRLEVPPRGTRPTSERVREAMFSALANRSHLVGASVLDLYAGSGALGLEAASRGARLIVMVESARSAAQVACRNVAKVKLRARVVQDRAERIAATLQREAPFDIVLMDPPYDIPETALNKTMVALGESGNLASWAVIVLEGPKGRDLPELPDGWEWQDVKTYGDTVVSFAGPGR